MFLARSIIIYHLLLMLILSCKGYLISFVNRKSLNHYNSHKNFIFSKFNPVSTRNHHHNMGNYMYNLIHNYYTYFLYNNAKNKLQNRPKSSLLSTSSTPADDTTATYTMQLKPQKDWNLTGLKEETSRQYLRTFKKVEKMRERLKKATANEDEVLNNYNEYDEMMILDYRIETEGVATRLSNIQALEEDLKKIRSVNDASFPDIMERVIALEINDFPPTRTDQHKVKKPKAAPTGPRKPYNRYMSVDKIIIKVGRSAADNDDLSLNPEHREGSHWWMHVAGSPGSHVVICNADDSLPSTYRQTLIDAALLAAVNSKAGQGGRVQVTYTRCRHVTKPYGAKAGLVFLKGDVATIRVDINAEDARLARLMDTKDKDALYES